MDFLARFKKFENDNLRFDQIQNPPSPYGDLCALLWIAKNVPSKKPYNILAAADHDIVYIDCDLEALNEVATDDDIKMLICCGVGLNHGDDYLHMFV